ncbi:UNVERIFIED_CONTAM: restriction system protein [Acetivibrio alkalicellulosi]
MRKIYISYSYKDNEINYTIKKLKNYFDDISINVITIEDFYQCNSNLFQSVTDIIDGCSIFICFMDRENPNIMFELGYALGKNKKIILVSDYNDIPYDLKQLTFIRKSNDISEILLSIEESLDYTRNYYDNMLSRYDYKQILYRSIEEPSFLDNIEAIEFENIVYMWLNDNGLNVQRPMHNRDLGCDFILYTESGRKIAIEVKKYRHTSKLSISVLRQLIGIMAVEHFDAGIIINTGQYTNSILHYVDEIEQNVLLWNIEHLYNISESIKQLEERLDSRI